MKASGIRRVGGAQAEMARQLGLVKITGRSAALLWEMNMPFVMAGSRVAPYHFFAGPYPLAHEVDPADAKAKSDYVTFKSLVNNFVFYLEPELGPNVAFFMRKEA